MDKEWFEDWFDSPYYHVLYKHRDENEAGGFAAAFCRMLDARAGETLLDLACGKGRHAIAFAREGLDVTGLDLSPESIAEANTHQHTTLRFHVHDMREVYCRSCFNYVVNLFTSFGYFRDPADNRKAAGAIAAALKPGGKFLIDFVNRSFARRNIEAHTHELKSADGIDFEIHRSYTASKLRKEIRVSDAGVVKVFTEEVNSFSPDEMNALFEGEGLQAVAQFGDYTFAPYDEAGSPRMIMLFQKNS